MKTKFRLSLVLSLLAASCSLLRGDDSHENKLGFSQEMQDEARVNLFVDDLYGRKLYIQQNRHPTVDFLVYSRTRVGAGLRYLELKDETKKVLEGKLVPLLCRRIEGGWGYWGEIEDIVKSLSEIYLVNEANLSVAEKREALRILRWWDVEWANEKLAKLEGIAETKASQSDKKNNATPTQGELTIHVTDEEGNSLKGVSVAVELYDEEPKNVYGRTNEDGLVTISGKTSKSDWKYFIPEKQHSSDYVDRGNIYHFDSVPQNGQWYPAHSKVNLVLKKKKNQVPMYVKNTGHLAWDACRIPQTGRLIQWPLMFFDLKKFDWYSWGKGEERDVQLYRGWEEIDHSEIDKLPTKEQREAEMSRILTDAYRRWTLLLDGTILPGLGGAYGYDLHVGDWVAPHGKGKVADFSIQIDRTNDESRGKERALKMTLSFANPGDGIITRPLTKLADGKNKYPAGSKNWAPSVASTEGYGKKAELDAPPSWEIMDHFYLFRVRSEMKDGKVLKGQYGKIAPWLTFYEKDGKIKLNLKYYLNPDPDSRSLEWDTDKNLMQPSAPYSIAFDIDEEG